ncbi:hypothetical protein HCK01_26420, partial [Streptomyces sp. AA8]|nr:hypothetical protein [Streptomyces telluris]
RHDDHGRGDHGRHDDHGRGDHDHGRPHHSSHAGGGATALASSAETTGADAPVLILAGTATAGLIGGMIWYRRRAAGAVKQ